MRRERGFALIWALLFLVLTSALSTVVLDRDRAMRRDAARDADAVRAYHAAEGALALARHALHADADFRGKTTEIGTCTAAVEVARDGPDAWRVAVVARPGNVRLEARLTRRDGLPSVASWHSSH